MKLKLYLLLGINNMHMIIFFLLFLTSNLFAVFENRMEEEARILNLAREEGLEDLVKRYFKTNSNLCLRNHKSFFDKYYLFNFTTQETFQLFDFFHRIGKTDFYLNFFKNNRFIDTSITTNRQQKINRYLEFHSIAFGDEVTEILNPLESFFETFKEGSSVPDVIDYAKLGNFFSSKKYVLSPLFFGHYTSGFDKDKITSERTDNSLVQKYFQIFLIVLTDNEIKTENNNEISQEDKKKIIKELRLIRLFYFFALAKQQNHYHLAYSNKNIVMVDKFFSYFFTPEEFNNFKNLKIKGEDFSNFEEKVEIFKDFIASIIPIQVLPAEVASVMFNYSPPALFSTNEEMIELLDEIFKSGEVDLSDADGVLSDEVNFSDRVDLTYAYDNPDRVDLTYAYDSPDRVDLTYADEVDLKRDLIDYQFVLNPVDESGRIKQRKNVKPKSDNQKLKPNTPIKPKNDEKLKTNTPIETQKIEEKAIANIELSINFSVNKIAYLIALNSSSEIIAALGFENSELKILLGLKYDDENKKFDPNIRVCFKQDNWNLIFLVSFKNSETQIQCGLGFNFTPNFSCSLLTN